MKWLQAGVQISVILTMLTTVGVNVAEHFAKRHQPEFKISIGSSFSSPRVNSERCGRGPIEWAPFFETDAQARDEEIRLSRCWEPA